MNLTYSKMNQCWFVVWNDQVVSVYETKDQATTDLSYKGLELQKDGRVVASTSGKGVL